MRVAVPQRVCPQEVQDQALHWNGEGGGQAIEMVDWVDEVRKSAPIEFH